MAFFDDETGETEEEKAAREKEEAKTKELRKVFRMFDADGGGTISVKELGNAMRSMGECLIFVVRFVHFFL